MAETRQKPAGRRKEVVGEVVSNKMNKTIVVAVTRKKSHPLYARVISTDKKFYAHDEKNEAHVGDGRVGDQLLDIDLPEGDQRGVDDGDHRQGEDQRREQVRSRREHRAAPSGCTSRASTSMLSSPEAQISTKNVRSILKRGTIS